MIQTIPASSDIITVPCSYDQDFYNSYRVYKVRDWINPSCLDFKSVSRLPESVGFFQLNPSLINIRSLSDNDNGMFFLEGHPKWLVFYKLAKRNCPKAMKAIEELLSQGHTKFDAWYQLSRNGTAINILKENIDKINWEALHANPYAMEILNLYPDKINTRWLSYNQSDAALDFLEKHQEQIDWKGLSSNTNPRAIKLLEANQDLIFWEFLTYNSSAIGLLKNNLDKLITTGCWLGISSNVNAVDIMKDNLDKLWWCAVSRNPGAIQLLEANPDKIAWGQLSLNPNPNAAALLESNQDKIYWPALTTNSVIFGYDYEFLRKRMNATIRNELMEVFYRYENIEHLKELQLWDGIHVGFSP